MSKFDLSKQEGFEQTLAAMYFAMTSLSTIGFGDLYPVNDLERLMGSFMLLSGVAVFSMVMGQLSFMVANMDILNGDQEDDDQLESFFVLLKKFNNNKAIYSVLQSQIRAFMKDKWRNDKNNFIINIEDQNLLSQLPGSCQTEIYTKFIFRNFLWKFRRFFNMKTSTQLIKKEPTYDTK